MRARSRRTRRASLTNWHRASQLDYSLMETQALVLGPTRELAQQIEKARSPRCQKPFAQALGFPAAWASVACGRACALCIAPC